MIGNREGIAAHIAYVMSAELGFSHADCAKTMKAVLEWPEVELARLWILELERFGWKVADLRSKPEADEFDPGVYFVDDKSVVSHQNIGEWIRTGREKAWRQVGTGDERGLLH
jgi:hypothetical protein